MFPLFENLNVLLVKHFLLEKNVLRVLISEKYYMFLN